MSYRSRRDSRLKREFKGADDVIAALERWKVVALLVVVILGIFVAGVQVGMWKQRQSTSRASGLAQ